MSSRLEIVGEAAQTPLSRRRARIPAVGPVVAMLTPARSTAAEPTSAVTYGSQLPDTHCLIHISDDDEDAALA